MKRLLFLFIVLALSVSSVLAQSKISSRLMDAMNRALEDNAPVRALVMLEDRVDIFALDQELYARKADLQDRAYTVITALQRKADETQPAVISSLNGRSSSEVKNIERFWVANMLLVEAIPAVLMELSQRRDVAYLDLDAELEWDRPVSRQPAPIESPNGIEPGIAAINAPAMWRDGYTGAGTIVMNIDTGVDGNHVALNYKWRGAQPGVPASAAWFDPNYNSTFPNDCDGHGTHTIGTMNGLAPSTHDTVGVAPGAQWIAAMTLCLGAHTSYSIAAFQWAMNPDGNPATIDDMPVAIGNSWYDPSISASTECNPAYNPYINVIGAVEAAGIAVVFSAGNSGPGAQTITQPKNVNIDPVHFWATGAVNGNTVGYPIASFSSRGPVVPACSTGVPSLDIKPEACAPGVNVRSSTPNNTYSYYDGTSMACPHVVGAIALLKQAHPTLTGHELKMALYQTAVDLGATGEDNTYGMGIIDVYAAHLSLADPTDPQPPSNFTAYSDISTPTSMLLTWTDPSTYVNGNPLTNFQIIIARDGSVIDSVNSGVQTYTNTGLTQYQEYTYEIWAKDYLDSTSSKVSATWMAGGYPPVMVVTPESISDTLLIGAVSQHQMRIYNNQTGPGPLNYTISENPSVSWLSVSQTSGTVNPNSNVVLTVEINSAGLSAGLHTTEIVVSGDDPFNPQETILVSLLANEPPVVGFTPDSLVFLLNPNQVDSSVMTILNSGTGPLYFTLSDEDLSEENLAKQAPDRSYLREEFNVEVAKSQDDWRRGTPQTEGAGGPDLYGYTWIDSDEPGGPTPNYIDISSTGSILTFTSMDDATALLSLPFNVEFYGQSYNEVRVGTNGWLTFTTSQTSSALSNTQIPSTTDPDNIIAILWDDLNGNNPNSNVYYQQLGNKFIIQFHNWNRFGHTGGDLNFQYVLYQNSETIELQYATMNFGTGTNATSHTIGIENVDGTDGLQVVFNAAYIHDNMAIVFKTESGWVSENPTSGTVPPGGSMDVQVIVNSAGLLGGVHRAQVIISSNDPVTPEAYMPVRLTVSGIPDISITPSQLAFDTLLVGATQDLTFEVSNIGTFPLTVSGITATNSAFSAAPTSFSVAPFASQVVTATFSPQVAGYYVAWLVVASDDPDTPLDSVLVTGQGNDAPIVGFTPDSLVFQLDPNQVDSSAMTITNTGAGPLYFTLSDEDLSEGLELKQVPDRSYLRKEFEVELTKGQDDWRRGTPQTEGAGGPDLYGYTWIDSDEPGGPTPNYIDISSTGTMGVLTYGTMDDGRIDNVALPFPVKFYGVEYNSITISTNGWVGFNNDYTISYITNAQIPNTALPNNIICALWDDLNGNNTNSHIYYQQLGNKFIIQFHNWNRFGHTGGDLNFQYVLYQNSETIELQYATMNFGTGTNATSHTIGIENVDGTDGLQVVFNAAYIHDNMAIVFKTESGWVSENPTSGTVPPGGSMDVQVIVNSAGLLGGVHRAQVIISSNDPVTPEAYMPVRLTVSGIPDISITPSQLAFDTLLVGATQDLTFEVSNIGTFPLTVSGITATNSAFSAAPTSFSVAPFASQVVTATFSPQVAGYYVAWLVVASDDPDTPLDSVLVTGQANEAPMIGISPDSLHFALNTGEVDSQMVVVTNSGNGPLIITNIEDEEVNLDEKTLTFVQPQMPSKNSVKGMEDPVGQPVIEGSGGPDPFGYKWIDSDEPNGPAYVFYDISTTGTNITSQLVPTGTFDPTDEGMVTVNLPFQVKFYGQSYNQLQVNSNGVVTFDMTFFANMFTNQLLPNSTAPNNLICPFWDDLDGDVDGNIFTQQIGNMFIIQWDNWHHYAAATTSFLTFQLVLMQNSSTIIFAYDQMTGHQDDATIGIENIDGTIALAVSNDQPYVHDQLLVKIAKGAEWLSEKPTSATIPAGGNLNLWLKADAAGMFGGNYLANVIINSNDPVNPQVKLPKVSLAVTGVPVISTTPASLAFDSTFVGLAPSQELLVTNAGTDQLIISNVSSTNPVFTVDTTHFTIGPLSNLPISVTFTPMIPGTYEGWIIISSNDAAHPLDSTYVVGVGVEAPVALIVSNFQNPVFVPSGDSTTVTINLANAGGSNLVWSATTSWQPVVLEKKIKLPTVGPKEPLTMAEVSPVLSTPSGILIDATWDLQFSFDVQLASGALGNAGAEFDGTYYYTTRWASNLLHKYDMAGTLVEEFSISGVTGLRDLAFDGTYMYGGAAANTIYMMDFNTKTLIGTIPSPVAVRNIAYDSENDAFWVGNWNTDLVLVSRTGTTLASIPATSHGLAGMYGSAYDNWSDGGPYLWVFDQGSGQGYPQYIHQINIATGTLTGVSHDVTLEFPAVSGIAGGLFTAEGIVPGKASIGGVLQGTPDMFFVYELTEASPPWIKLLMTSGVVAPGDNTDLPIRIYGMSAISDTAFVVIQTNDPTLPVANIEIHKTMVSGLDGLAQLPTTFDISQNYPNPFNPLTTIKYQLPMLSEVKLVIYNVLGQKVRTLLNKQMEAGYHSVIWDGRNDEGRAVASGIYIYRFEAGDFQKTMKLMLLK